MSMIEKFLSEKDELFRRLDETREEMQKAMTAKGDAMVDEFAEKFKVMIAEASDREFIDFITSGKLDDDEINYAIVCRADARKGDEAKVCDEPCTQPNETDEKHEPRVHVFVLEV